MKQSLWFILLVAITALWFRSSDALWQYLFLLRVPILIGLLLLLLPTIAQNLLSAMLKNLFVLRSKWQLAFVIVSAVAAGMSVIIVTCAILNNAPERFGVPSIIKISEFWQYLLAIALALPTCITIVNLSREQPKKIKLSDRLIGILIGGGLSLGLLFATGLLHRWLTTDTEIQQLFLKLIPILGSRGTYGYVKPHTGELAAGHLEAIAFLLVGSIAYVAVGLRFRPQARSNRTEVPTLVYLLIIITMATLFFGGVTFYFDYSRVPILVLFLAFSALSYVAFDVDHFFQLHQLENNEPDKKPVDDDCKNFKKVLEKRLEHQTEERTLVIVCTSGGGIQASGWTAKVLSGLQQELGHSFTRAIGFISAVSGGSLGTMYYLDHFGEQGYPKDDELEQIFNSATKDSLDAVGWGLAYLDLWRFIGLPFMIRSRFDRGTSVETDWQGEMKGWETDTKQAKTKKTLATWRKQIFDGAIPIPIFNATTVENGYRFMITPMTFGNGNGKKCHDFNTLYGSYDIDVVTAARLSATFPYVSPISRPQNIPNNNFHFADGGYFDNSGFATVAELLDEQLGEWCKPEGLNIKRVLFLQINPFASSPSIDKAQGKGGWFMATIGPLLALYKVRDPILSDRNAIDADFIKQKWKNQVDIQYFPIFFPSAEDLRSAEKTPTFYTKEGRYQPPLSWRLSDQEKEAIHDGWEAIKEKQIKEIKALWQQTWKIPSIKP
jgi:hypothetical protein